MPADFRLPDPALYSSIGWVSVIIVAIIVGIRQAIGLLRDLRERPTGSEALHEAHQLFASKEALDKLEIAFGHYQEAERKDAAARRLGIYDRIEGSRDEVLRRIDEVRREVEDKIKDVHARVDTLPDRLITTLRNTGAIQAPRNPASPGT